MLDVLKGLERGVLLGAVPGWEVVGVLSPRLLVSGWSDGTTGESPPAYLGGCVLLQPGLGLGIELAGNKLLVLAAEGLELEGRDIGDRDGLDFDGGGSHCDSVAGFGLVVLGFYSTWAMEILHIQKPGIQAVYKLAGLLAAPVIPSSNLSTCNPTCGVGGLRDGK